MSDLRVMVNRRTGEKRTITPNDFMSGKWWAQGWDILDPPTAGVAAKVDAPDGPPPLEVEKTTE